MKLRKNDLQELKKASMEVILAKLREAKEELSKAKLAGFRANDQTNVRLTKITRRTIAQLNTLISGVKE